MAANPLPIKIGRSNVWISIITKIYILLEVKGVKYETSACARFN